MEEVKTEAVSGGIENPKTPSKQEEDVVIKSKYGPLMSKKPPLISKDHERAYFDSADWALGKQGAAKPKGPLEALRPKLQPTQQQTRYRKSPCAPTEGEDGSNVPSSEDATPNEGEDGSNVPLPEDATPNECEDGSNVPSSEDATPNK
ncbi:unnamed protein product [Cuscuta europaea]|uniref:Endosulphine n=1 Tax=Cuscuta europaea TaxID=41803 RepID=A0A9P0ZF38_CUSEU|nr:unnamed protein product [Cuscuta europaea]